MAIIGGVAEEDKHKDTSILVSIGIKHPGLVVCYIFLNSFLLAAFVEELCKYFGYVMVQHPDFMLQETDLLLDRSENVEEGDDVESEYEEEGDGEEEQEEESQNEDEDEVKRTFEKNFSSSSTITAPMRDFNSIGMGITIAMMSVALGFACCENLIYIFVYTGGNVQTGAFSKKKLFNTIKEFSMILTFIPFTFVFLSLIFRASSITSKISISSTSTCSGDPKYSRVPSNIRKR